MKYPIGIQNFESLIDDGYIYVDKTAYAYKLASTGRYYFLSRPRRFGKSLFLSTLEAYFQGKRHLFKGLALEKLEKEWTQHPVLRLDLNTGDYTREGTLEKALNYNLCQWERAYGKGDGETALETRFAGSILRAYEQTGQRVVILVDEYDKPLLATLGNEELQTRNRNTLKAFYSVLKTQDRYIRFAFLTGVTKFSKVSIFSDLNNLNDITMLPQYAGVCGISETELHANFEEQIGELAAANSMTREETCDRLREWYDGYHFAWPSEGMYNPFSLLSTFGSNIFGDYWFQTGTPTFLVQLLKEKDFDLEELPCEQATADLIGGVETMDESPLPVLYQSGYLTLRGFDPDFRLYQLGFPNREVEQGFTQFLLPHYSGRRGLNGPRFLADFVRAVRQGRPEDFLRGLKTLFDDSDYRVAGDTEKYFQNCLYLVFRLMGFYTQVERATSQGRIDVVIHTKDYLYVMELKLDATAKQALEQIDAKGYALPFRADGRHLYKVGVGSSSAERSLKDWLIK